MADRILLTQERHGLKYELVEGISDCVGSRVVRVRVLITPHVCRLFAEQKISWKQVNSVAYFTPEQCDVLGTFGSLARARENLLAKLQEKSDEHEKTAGING